MTQPAESWWMVAVDVITGDGASGAPIQPMRWYIRSLSATRAMLSNGGRTLTEYQVVRSLVRLGDWTCAAAQYPLPETEAEGAILFVQPDQPGPMLAAQDVTEPPARPKS